MKPITYLLCGLPASGKTTYAKKLEKEGVLRLTLDEELFKKFGRHFESGYTEKEVETRESLKDIWKENALKGNSTILDYGFWKKADRDAYKKLAGEFGTNWRLIYFKADYKTLLDRLTSRNKTDIKDNHDISPEMFEDFTKQFEAPEGEGEVIV